MTVTVTGPAVVSNDWGTLTTSEFPFCDKTVTAVAPKVTVDEAMKLVPVIVRLKPCEPAATLDGESVVTVGTGLLPGA